MTSNENLLVMAMEECNKLSMAISKALRFGVENYCAESGDIKDNNYPILEKYIQLETVIDMLLDRKILNPVSDTVYTAIRLEKEKNVDEYQEH